MSPKPKRILVINGHPDRSPDHLCAALADAYAAGAREAGHTVDRLDVGALDFPLIRSLADYQSPRFTDDIKRAQELAQHADHLVLVFPIWFGGPPAALKGFFEQLLRKGFALSSPQSAMMSLLNGKSARLIVTMGAPVSLFRLVLGGHGVAALERGLLWVVGVAPVRHTLLGRVHNASEARRAEWLAEARRLGRRGA